MTDCDVPASTLDRVLVAGIGNIFLSDDGFGVEVIRQLSTRQLPPEAELQDVGVRGVHLAYQLLDGYHTVVLVDASARGGEPGALYLIDGTEAADEGHGQAPAMDGHHMSPDAVIGLLATLRETIGGSKPSRVLIVGCEPACLDEGIGLSPPVAAAVEQAAELVLQLVGEASEVIEPGQPAMRRSE